MMLLEGRVAFLTGVGSGIGRAGALALAGKGSIIITASNSGVQYDRGMIACCTTKHAVIALTRQIAVDYTADNIRYNALCRGIVDTPFNDGFQQQMGGRAA